MLRRVAALVVFLFVSLRSDPGMTRCLPFGDCPGPVDAAGAEAEVLRLRALMWQARNDADAERRRADRNEAAAVAAVVLLLLVGGAVAAGGS